MEVLQHIHTGIRYQKLCNLHAGYFRQRFLKLIYMLKHDCDVFMQEPET